MTSFPIKLHKTKELIIKTLDPRLPFVSFSARLHPCGNPALQPEMGPRKMKKGCDLALSFYKTEGLTQA